MATIKDVAKRAVWNAIKQLSYSHSAVARSLKINRTKSIGLLASTSEAPYFAEIIESIEHQCFARGYTLILCNSHNEPHNSKPICKCWRKSASTVYW